MAHHVFYITNFPGHWPVGTSALVVAPDRVSAFNLLAAKLRKHGLTLTWQDVGPTDFIQLDLNDPHAVVLQDGDY